MQKTSPRCPTYAESAALQTPDSSTPTPEPSARPASTRKESVAQNSRDLLHSSATVVPDSHFVPRRRTPEPRARSIPRGPKAPVIRPRGSRLQEDVALAAAIRSCCPIAPAQPRVPSARPINFAVASGPHDPVPSNLTYQGLTSCPPDIRAHIARTRKKNLFLQVLPRRGLDQVFLQLTFHLADKHPCLISKHPCLISKHPCLISKHPPTYENSCIADSTCASDACSAHLLHAFSGTILGTVQVAVLHISKGLHAHIFSTTNFTNQACLCA